MEKCENNIKYNLANKPASVLFDEGKKKRIKKIAFGYSREIEYL